MPLANPNIVNNAHSTAEFKAARSQASKLIKGIVSWVYTLNLNVCPEDSKAAFEDDAIEFPDYLK